MEGSATAVPKITIRVANAEKLETQFLPELASGGLFIRSDKFLPLGAEVDIDLYLPSATEALPLKGRVTKVIDDEDARARKATGMSLAVDANSEPTRSRLEALYTAYKIPVKRAQGGVSPGQPANGAYSSNAPVPLPAPSSLGASIGAIPLPSPNGPGGNSLPAADDDLPSPKSSPPSIAPSIPSIAPAIPPAVPVMKFEKHGSGNGASSRHQEAVDPYADTAPPAESKPLPFPFQRTAPTPPPPPPEVPSFSALSHGHPSAPPPPPPPAAPHVDTSKFEARIKELEASEAKAKADARKAVADKEALEAKHAEATKRLNDEIAALQRRPAGGNGRSPIPAALIGLLIGAGATFGYFNFLAPKPEATTSTGGNTVAVVDTKPVDKPLPTDNGAKTPDQPAVNNGAGDNGAAMMAAAGTNDAGTTGAADTAMAAETMVKDAGTVAAVADTKPVETASATKDAGTGAMLAAADVGGSKTPEVKPEDKTPPTNPEKVADDPPPLAVEDKKPVDKKPVVAKKPPPQNEPIGENAGVLNLRSDMPASVYVNGKKVGNAPALGVKANPGKVTVRFDCVVEDVRVKGKNRIVNLAPKGTANVDYSCIE